MDRCCYATTSTPARCPANCCAARSLPTDTFSDLLSSDEGFPAPAGNPSHIRLAWHLVFGESSPGREHVDRSRCSMAGTGLRPSACGFVRHSNVLKILTRTHSTHRPQAYRGSVRG